MPLIRPATNDDLASVAAIYAHEVRTAHSTFDLEPPPASYWEDRLTGTGPGDHLLVAEDPSAGVVGYALSWVYRPRAAYLHTRETSLYVAEAARGQGLGRELYDVLLPRLVDDGVHTVLALIALPNDASEALHAATGFSRVGTLTEVGYKFGRWIDTAWWQKRLT